MNRRLQNRFAEFGALLTSCPQAYAVMEGSEAYPALHGIVWLYRTQQGVLIAVQMHGLPEDGIFGLHIHSGSQCTGDAQDPFSGAMGHYNPANMPHPFHAGDLPPLFGNSGYAFSAFLTDRFTLPEVIGKTVILHRKPDDFITQPSGNSGEKIACGVIDYRSRCQ